MSSSERHARIGLAAVAFVFLLAMGILSSKAIDRHVEHANAAPDFSLPDLDGKTVSLTDIRNKTAVLVFWSARGPVSNEYSQRIIRLASNYANDSRVAFLAIDATVSTVEPSVIDGLRVFKNVIGQTFPMLIDPGAKVAERFDVQVTPTVLVIDPRGQIRYRGAFDDNQNEKLASKHYCADALTSLLAERPVATTFTQAFGRPIRQPR